MVGKVSRSWPHPRKGELEWIYLAQPCSLSQPRLWAVCVSGFRSFFFFPSWLKYFAKDQVIREWSEEGAGVAPLTSKAGYVNL